MSTFFKCFQIGVGGVRPPTHVLRSSTRDYGVLLKRSRKPSSTLGIYRPITSMGISQRFLVAPSNNFHSSPSRLDVVPFKLSDIGEGIKEVTIKEWFVKEGDKVAQFDQICEVQSDKASVTITSRYDGIIKKIYHAIDETALVGNPLVDIEVEESEKAPGDEVVQEGDAIQVGRPEESFGLPLAPSSGDKVLATPAVRRIAAEHKVDLKDVTATGRDGRVLKEDILGYLASSDLSSAARAIPEPTVSPARKTDSPSSIPKTEVVTPRAIPVGAALPDRSESVKGYTKAMIKTMTAANAIPHFGYCDEIELSELVKLRKQYKVQGDKYGVKITYMPFFIKAASMALSDFPILNSVIDLTNDKIIYKGSHNIGVAMDTKLGLIVPNVKNIQSKSILDIAVELARLHSLGQKGSIGTTDLSGGTFTLSNIGSIGGTYAKAVILPPEVCIAALGKTQVLPRFDSDGNVIRAHIMNVSWSADHRLIDGATMARFSNTWKAYLENPASMLLQLK